jgi:hypothetical protein
MSYILHTSSPAPAPTLRWIYAKGDQHVVCELSLDATHSVYELRTAVTGQRHYGRSEQFADVTPAFLRHIQLEAGLIEQGWTPEWYERDPPRSTVPRLMA